MVFLLEPKLLGTIFVGVNQVATIMIFFHTGPRNQKKLCAAKCTNYLRGGFQMFLCLPLPGGISNLINAFQMGRNHFKVQDHFFVT